MTRASQRIGLLLVVTGALLCGLTSAQAAEDGPAFAADRLPADWKLVQEVRVPAEQLVGFSQRFGGRIEDLWNQVISIGGLQVRVNTLITAEDAVEVIHAKMLSYRGEDFIQRSGRRVFEVAGDNLLVARRVFHALGTRKEAKATWEVSFRIALVEKLDDTAGNRVFNHFLALAKDPDAEAPKQAIARDTKGWVYGNTLRLLTPAEGRTWTFDPEPVETKPHGLVTHYRFEEPPRAEGIPYVDVKGTIVTYACFAPTRDPRAIGGRLGLTAPTAFWPAADERVREVAAKAVEGATTEREKLLALLGTVNERVKYGGAMGTRDGVKTVLERGLGRCWDKADVLVSLCRAAAIPARQVGGWVPAIGAGHIWTEVHVDGGWLPVDATTTWLGISEDYIPFYATEDGVMPIVYLAWPGIRRLK